MSENESLLRELLVETDEMGIDIFGVANAREYTQRFPDYPSPDLFVPNAQSIIIIAEIVEPTTMRTLLHPELARSTCFHQQDSSVGARHDVNPQKYFMIEETELVKSELTRIGRHIVRKLRRLGYSSFNLPLCKSDSVSHLAPFVHAPAIWLAGLGTLGRNGVMLTPEFGPRFYVNSIITDCPLPPGRPLRDDLCRGCGLCARACPIGALHQDGSKDLDACREYNTCGTCIAVCPIGKVRPFPPAEVVRWLKSERETWTLEDAKRGWKA